MNRFIIQAMCSFGISAILIVGSTLVGLQKLEATLPAHTGVPDTFSTGALHFAISKSALMDVCAVDFLDREYYRDQFGWVRDSPDMSLMTFIHERKSLPTSRLPYWIDELVLSELPNHPIMSAVAASGWPMRYLTKTWLMQSAGSGWAATADMGLGPGVRIIWVMVVLQCTTISLFLFTIIYGYGWVVRKRRCRNGQCSGCGYSIRNLPESPELYCPECGRRINSPSGSVVSIDFVQSIDSSAEIHCLRVHKSLFPTAPRSSKNTNTTPAATYSPCGMMSPLPPTASMAQIRGTIQS